MHRVDLHLEKGYILEIVGKDIRPKEVKHTVKNTPINYYENHEFESNVHFGVSLKNKKGVRIALIHSIECNY